MTSRTETSPPHGIADPSFLSAPVSWTLQNTLGRGGAIRRQDSAIKAELHSPETAGLNWETIEKQRKLLVDESSTLPLIKVDAKSLSVRIRELFQQNSLEFEQEDFHQENSRASKTWEVSFNAEGRFIESRIF